jgi:hypothetical protein
MDFRIINGGSVYLVTPITQDAKTWVEENVFEAQWFGGGFAVEPRYVEDVTRGMLEAGLTGTLDGHVLSVTDGEVTRAA